jgi:hypothetical protein
MLLVVYATGGSASEKAAAKAGASAVREINSYAKLRIKPDSAVSVTDLDRSSVALIGKADNLRIPAIWKSKLPLRYTQSTIRDAATGLTSTGTDLWGISIGTHPSNPKWILVHTASTSPQALRGFRFQDNLPPTESRIIATSTGKLVAARRSAAESGNVAYVSP